MGGGDFNEEDVTDGVCGDFAESAFIGAVPCLSLGDTGGGAFFRASLTLIDDI